MKYKLITGEGLEAEVHRTYEKTEVMNLPELIEKIHNMRIAIVGKIDLHNHFVDTLQNVVDGTGLKIAIPKKIEIKEL